MTHDMETEVVIKIEGRGILDDLKKVLKDIKQERKRIEKLLKEAR